MKKLLPKKRRAKKSESAANSRITNETVAAHREHILTKGKKFKYPHQYLRHRLVINAVIIGAITLVAAAGIAWQQLYIAQNTSDFMYRLTRVVPVPVAEVQDERVRYSDYLMRYRSQELLLRDQGQLGLSEQDAERQLDFMKRGVMDAIQLDAYAATLARERNITVSSEDIDEVIDRQRNTSTGRISSEVYEASNRASGYSPSEFRRILEQSLLRERVAYAVDDEAGSIRDQVAEEVASEGADFQAIVQRLNEQGTNVEFGASGLVPASNKDGGLTQAALSLEDGEISEPIRSNRVDDYGYFFVQKLSSTDRQVSYQYIKVPLTKFTADFEKLKRDGGVREFITLDEVEQQTQPARPEGDQ